MEISFAYLYYNKMAFIWEMLLLDQIVWFLLILFFRGLQSAQTAMEMIDPPSDPSIAITNVAQLIDFIIKSVILK